MPLSLCRFPCTDLQTLVRNGAYQALDLTIAQALKQRSHDFAGVVTCSPKDSLSAVFALIRIRRVHRLVVVAGPDEPQPGQLVGVISLSDIMRELIVRLCVAHRRGTADKQGRDVEPGGSGIGAQPVDRVLRAEAAATAEEESAPEPFNAGVSLDTDESGGMQGYEPGAP